MRKIIVVVSFLFSVFSFSQKDLKDFLLVKKDSISFYVFNKKGVHVSTFKNKINIDSEFKPYKEKVPKSLNSVLFNSLSSVNLHGVIYFLFPGGGVLYRYSDNRIERIDKSFPHRNQYSGYFFSFKDNLYLLGGYGYWTAKNYLTRFNFQSGTWEIVNTTGQLPKKGINQGSFIKSANSLLVFDFYKKAVGSNKDLYNNNFFELDLLTLRWTKKGVLSSKKDFGISQAITSARINYENSLFQKVSGETSFQIISPLENKVVTFLSSNKLMKLGKFGIFVGDNLVYPSKNADNKTSKVAFVNIKKFQSVETRRFAIDDRYLFQVYLMFAGIFSFVLVLGTYSYFVAKKKTYYVNSFSLFNGSSSFLLSKEESELLKAFKNGNILENSFILELFSDDTKTLDAIIKKKNRIITDFNVKFKDCFKRDLILKNSSIIDSRQINYVISKSIEIVFQD